MFNKQFSMFNVQGSKKPLMLGCNKNLFSRWNIILVGGDANKGGREPLNIEQGISNVEGLG
jgi:hypothetical protein